eukprot:1190713-Prorocentrum_minimum.AAC.1
MLHQAGKCRALENLACELHYPQRINSIASSFNIVYPQLALHLTGNKQTTEASSDFTKVQSQYMSQYNVHK